MCRIGLCATDYTRVMVIDCFIIRLCHLFKDAFQTVRMSFSSLTYTHTRARMHVVVICNGVRNGGNGAYLMYGNTSVGVRVLHSSSFYMCQMLSV